MTVSAQPISITKADLTPAEMADMDGVDMREIVGDWNLLNSVSKVAVNSGRGTPESKTSPSLRGLESMSKYLYSCKQLSHVRCKQDEL